MKRHKMKIFRKKLNRFFVKASRLFFTQRRIAYIDLYDVDDLARFQRTMKNVRRLERVGVKFEFYFFFSHFKEIKTVIMKNEEITLELIKIMFPNGPAGKYDEQSITDSYFEILDALDKRKKVS